MTSARIVERPELADEELNALFSSAWEHHERRSFSTELARSLTYFGAYQDTKLVGFVNVAWDGGAHAFLLDPTVLPDCRRQGIGTALVRAATKAASLLGAEWLHVDYVPLLEPSYLASGFTPSRAGILRLPGAHNVAAVSAVSATAIAYRTGPAAVTVPSFLELARRVWQRELDAGRTAAALAATRNIGAWIGGRLIGSVRVLSDGYVFSTVPELMVDPDYRHRGVGSELMHRALRSAPGGRLFFGAQSGNEGFFERIGFVRGPTGFVGKVEDLPHPAAG